MPISNYEAMEEYARSLEDRNRGTALYSAAHLGEYVPADLDPESLEELEIDIKLNTYEKSIYYNGYFMACDDIINSLSPKSKKLSPEAFEVVKQTIRDLTNRTC